MKWRYDYRVFLSAIIMGLTLACSAKPTGDKIVLKAGEQTMTINQLNWQYLGESFANPEEEYQKKSAYLQSILNKKLIAIVGLEQGFGDSVSLDSAALARILQFTYYQVMLADKLNPPLEDVRKYWDKYGGVLQVAQVVVETESQADNVYQTLKKEPQKFAEYAAQVSIDMATKDKGGVIDSLRAGRMAPEFEEVVFNLRPGEISRPFKTDYGWHIVRLISRQKHQPQDFQAERVIYEKIYFQKLLNRLQSQMLEKIYKVEDLTIVDQTLARLKARRDSLQNVDRNQGVTPRAFLEPTDLTKEEMNLPLAESKAINVTALDYVRHFKTWGLRPGVDPTDKKLALDVVKKMTSTLMVLYYSAQNKIQDTPEYKWQVDDLKMGLIYRKVMEGIKSSITASDQEVKEFYDNNPNDFRESERVRVSEILVGSENAANTIARELRQGTPFGRLAERSIREGIAEKQGDLGYLNSGDSGIISDEAFKLNIGQVGGPIAKNGKYSIIQVSDKKPARERPLADVAGQIKNIVMQEKLRAKVATIVDEQKKKVENFIDLDLLKANLKTGKLTNAN